MIESIAITNFYCFKEKTELSFVAGRERNKSLADLFSGFTEQNRVNLLRTVYLYGDNGAGKSKLLQAFETLQELVTEMRDDKTDRLPYHEFALDPFSEGHEPSEIEMVYHFDGRRYRYEIKWNDRSILEENLYLLRLTTDTMLFHRWYDEEARIARVEFSRAIEIDDDTEYVIKTSLLRNNSVISSIANNNIYNKVLHDQLSFFRYGFELLDFHEIDLGDSLPDDRAPNSGKEARALKKVILTLLRSLGSNIVNYEKIPLPKKLPSFLTSKMKNMSEDEKNMFLEFMEMAPDYAVTTYHNVGVKRPMPLDLEDQSEGTKEILRLVMCMHEAISQHKTILLDDCINGIHPKTLEQLMKFYLGASEDSQLIIASQNFSNLDASLIRRDSLRFVKKDKNGRSHVAQLALGDLHKNQNLRMQIENSEKWGVRPWILDDVLEEAIMDYRRKMGSDSGFCFSELF